MNNKDTAPLPYFKFWVKDYLGSSTVAQMSLVAEAIYLKLLMYQWEKGILPESVAFLCRMVRATPQEFSEFEPFLDYCFPIIDGGRANARLHADRIVTAGIVETNRENGGKGGRPRKPNGLANGNRTVNRTGNRNETERVTETKPISESESESYSELDISSNEDIILPDGNAPAAPPNGALLQGDDVEKSFIPQGQKPESIQAGRQPKASPRQPRAESARATDHAAFDEFWRVFPKREGNNSRKVAQELFAKATKKHDPQVVIDGAKRYAALMESKGAVKTSFVQMASTWLRQENWENPYDSGPSQTFVQPILGGGREI